MKDFKKAGVAQGALRVSSLAGAILMASMLTACGGGGGGGSSGSDNANASTQSDPNAAHVAGYVMKGAVAHGVVTAYSVVSGQKGELLANALTDASGYYSLNIPSSYSGAIKIEVRAASDSTMVCDAAEGCGDAAAIPSFDTNRNGKIDFGEEFPLDSDFELDAAIPNVTGGTTVNAAVTTITHLATQYAGHFSGGLSSDSIAQANSQAANIFSITGNILNLTPPNLASADSIASADSAAVHYAVMSAAILGVVDRDNLGAKLNDLAQTFAGLNGQLYQNHALDNSVSLDEIAEQAFALADKLDLNESRTKAARLLQTARHASNSSLTDAQSSPTSNASADEKAKQLVADINEWTGILNFKSEDGIFAVHQAQLQQNLVPSLTHMQKTLGGVAAWGLIPALPELAIASYCNSLPSVSKALCNSVISTEGISRACIHGSGLMLFGKDICDVLTRIKLVKKSNFNVVYNMIDGTVTAQGVVNGDTVDLTMTANTSSSGKRLSFTIAGSVDNSEAHLELSSSTVNFDFADDINLLKLKAPETATAEFNGNLAQKASETVTDPISFDGQLTLDVDLSNLALLKVRSGEQLVQNVSNTLTSTNAKFNLTLAGSISSQSGDTLDSALSVHGGETNTYALSYGIKSNSMASTAYATLSGTIDKTQMKPVTLELNYAGRTLIASNDEQDLHHYSIQNQDGVNLDVNLNPALTGSVGGITLDATSLADILHQNSAYLVEFTDGSNATLNL